MVSHSKRLFKSSLAAALAAAAILGAGVRGADGGLVPDGPAPDLFLVYTGDVIGYVDPCG